MQTFKKKKKKRKKTMKPMVTLNLYEELNAIKNHFPCLGEISPSARAL